MTLARPKRHALTLSRMSGPPPNVRIVLVNTTHPGNIGAVARAMKNMGLRELYLVDPKVYPSAEATARASGADDVLADAVVCNWLDQALADCPLVIGASARARAIDCPRLTPRECAALVLSRAHAGPAAVLFGREHSGLSNAELDRCHFQLSIPVDPDFPSLNLAAAVQVLSYELRCAMLGDLPALQDSAQRTAPPAAGAASHAELEGLFGQLAEALEQIDFHKGRAPDSAMRKLRRLYLRANLDSADVRLLRGVLADAQRMARLAGEGTGAAKIG